MKKQISLLTIGYGDFSPKTGAGRTFFIIWSLVAVPTMTILAGDLTSTGKRNAIPWVEIYSNS